MPPRGELVGLVLAGGMSRRMGQDKALICPDGKENLLQRAYAKLSVICSHVYVSCASGRKYESFPCIEDRVAGRGPMAGIMAGLEALKGKGALLVLGCDMPLVPVSMLRHLARIRETRAEYGMIAWQSALTGKIQTLAALYESFTLPFFKDALDRNHFGLWDIVPENLRFCQAYEPEREVLFNNCNTPADLSVIDWTEAE